MRVRAAACRSPCGRALAGLAAYASWVPTIGVLVAPDGPVCVFTDFCEEAAIRGAQLLASAATTAGQAGTGFENLSIMFLCYT